MHAARQWLHFTGTRRGAERLAHVAARDLLNVRQVVAACRSP